MKPFGCDGPACTSCCRCSSCGHFFSAATLYKHSLSPPKESGQAVRLPPVHAQTLPKKVFRQSHFLGVDSFSGVFFLVSQKPTAKQFAYRDPSQNVDAVFASTLNCHLHLEFTPPCIAGRGFVLVQCNRIRESKINPPCLDREHHVTGVLAEQQRSQAANDTIFHQF